MIEYPMPFGGTVVAYRPEDRERFLGWALAPRPRTALDTETAGLGLGDPVRLVQFGDERVAWVLQAERDRPVIAEAVPKVQHPVLWNAAFDVERLSRMLGIDFAMLLARCSDTQVLAGVLDPRAAWQGGIGHSLEEWAEHLIGPEAVEPTVALDALFREKGWGSRKSRKGAGWATVPLGHPAYIRYAGADALLTARVHALLAGGLRDRSGWARKEQQVARITAQAQHTGLLLDLDHTERLRVHYADMLTEAQQRLKGFGIEKVGSTKQIADRLRAEGLEDFIGVTEVGNASVPKDVLKKVQQHGSEAAGLVLVAKKAKRFSRDFAEVYQAAAAFDGRVHPGLRSIGTKTRRMTCSRPNIQQVPKEKTGPLLVRDCFAAAPGNVLLRADFANMEFRYAAQITGDPRMLADCAPGAPDPFLLIAEQVWPGRAAEYRQQAKIVTYAVMYGAGASTLAAITGLREREAAALKTAVFRRWRVLKAKFYDAMEGVRARGGATLPRSGWLPSRKDRPHVGLNLLVQGGCRDGFGESLLALDGAGMTPHLRMLIHDEAVWEVPAEHAVEAARIVQRLMPFDGIPVDWSTHRSWGAAYLEDQAAR